MSKIKTLVCTGRLRTGEVCGARISYKEGEPPTGCPCCHLKFVNEPVAVIDDSKPEPKVVKIGEPARVAGKTKGVK